MIENVLTALSTDDNILFFDEYSGDATFCCSQMGILSIDLSNINFYDIIIMKMILKLLFISGILNLKNVKHLKKDK